MGSVDHWHDCSAFKWWYRRCDLDVLDRHFRHVVFHIINRRDGQHGTDCVRPTLKILACLHDSRDRSLTPSRGGQYHWVSEFAPRKHQQFLSYMTGWLSVWLTHILNRKTTTDYILGPRLANGSCQHGIQCSSCCARYDRAERPRLRGSSLAWRTPDSWCGTTYHHFQHGSLAQASHIRRRYARASRVRFHRRLYRFVGHGRQGSST
jgi:hypothetical protein